MCFPRAKSTSCPCFGGKQRRLSKADPRKYHRNATSTSKRNNIILIDMQESDNLLLCQFCGHGPEIEDVAGQLHAEVDDESDKTVTAHHRCMQYASALSQYKCDEFGGFDISEVEKEIRRGKKMSCNICKASKGKKSKGACCGCAVKSCRKTFHFPCAHSDQETVTKRLVVTKNRDGHKEKFVLYRVFCSKEHAALFRTTLKEELRTQKGSKKQDSTGADRSLDNSQAFHNTSVFDVSLPGESRVNSPDAAARERFSSPESQSSLQHEGHVSNGEGEDDSTAAPLAKPSKKQKNERRESGPVRRKPGRPRKHVSQSPSVSLIEELSHSAKRGQASGNVTATSDDALSPSFQKFQVLSEAESGAPSASVLVHTSPRSESAENLSPNIPVSVSPRRQSDVIKSSYDCFVQIDNILSVEKEATHSPNNKASSSTLNHTAQQVCMHSSPSVSERNPFKAPLASPAKTVQDVSGHQNSLSATCSTTPVKNSLLVVGTNSKSTPTRGTSSPQQQANSTSPGRFPLTLQPSPGKLLQVSQSSPSGLSPRNSSPFTRLRGQSESPGKGNSSLTGNSTAAGNLSAETGTKQNSPRSLRPAHLNSKVGKKCDSISNRNTDTGGSVSSEAEEEQSNLLAVAGASDASCEQNRRKRKANCVSDSNDVPVSKKTASRQLNKNISASSEASILLIPSNMEDFAQLQPIVEEMAAEELMVDKSSFCVWQQAAALHALPPELLLFFMLDLVKELQNEDSEALLTLLFDGECLPARLNNYLIQAQIFQNLNDEKTQKDIQQAILEGIQRSVKPLPMVQTLHLNDQNLVTMAIDFRLCTDNQKMLAYLQAYRGLFWWKEDTEIISTPISPVDQRVAAAREALTLKLWLTKVNPVTEVTVFPQDEYLLDKTTLAHSSELVCLVQSVRDNVAHITALTAAATTQEGEQISSTVQVVPLLVFEPVDFVVLNFQLYFRKVCQEFFSLRGLSRFLALVPLCNLPEHTSMESITSLLKDLGEEKDRHDIYVCTAFSPQTQHTSILLLEISAAQQDAAEEKATMGTPSKGQNEAAANAANKQSKKRGRKKKITTE